MVTAAAAFENAFEELFEELLISPWQRRMALRRGSPGAVVIDLGTRYEVRIPASRAEAERSEVEVSEHRLSVRMSSPAGIIENIFDFAHAVETESVTASLVGNTLQIVLPQRRGRKIEVE